MVRDTPNKGEGKLCLLPMASIWSILWKLIHETSCPQRAEKYTEIEIGGSKIDFYDAKNKMIVPSGN